MWTPEKRRTTSLSRASIWSISPHSGMKKDVFEDTGLYRERYINQSLSSLDQTQIRAHRCGISREEQILQYMPNKEESLRQVI